MNQIIEKIKRSGKLLRSYEVGPGSRITKLEDIDGVTMFISLEKRVFVNRGGKIERLIKGLLPSLSFAMKREDIGRDFILVRRGVLVNKNHVIRMDGNQLVVRVLGGEIRIVVSRRKVEDISAIFKSSV